MPYQYEVIKEYYSDSSTVSELEQYIIDCNDSYNPHISFGGRYECLTIDSLANILRILESNFKIAC